MATPATETKQTQETKHAFANPFTTAMDYFGNAVTTGMRFQQDMLNTMFNVGDMPKAGNGANPMSEMKDRVETVANEATTSIKTNMATSQKLFDETSRTGMDLMHKCFETMTPKSDADRDLMKTTRRFWEDTFHAMKTNADAVAKANVGMIENFTNFMSRTTQAWEPKAGRN